MFEYKVVNLRAVVDEARKDKSRESVGDHVLVVEHMNMLGMTGWEAITNPENMVVWFKREKKDA